MRAGSHIQILSDTFDITLAIVGDRLRGAQDDSILTAELRQHCAAVIVINRVSTTTPIFRVPNAQLRILLQALWPVPAPFAQCGAALVSLAEQLTGRHFDVVHCFRLETAPVIQLLRQNHVAFRRSVLDFDAYESQMAFRAVRLLPQLVGRQWAAVQWLEAFKWRALESRLIPRFDDVYVCSEPERQRLRRRFPQTRWHLVPNIVAEPAVSFAQAHSRFSFLFVGILHWPPNIDAVVFFCTRVLPLLRQTTNASFDVLLAGRNPEPAVMHLTRIDGVQVVANPADLAPFYSRADAAIVPLRGGGGTRLKILEAFSYGVPVISTTIGAEGLDVTPDLDILIADDAGAFAAQCRRIWADKGLRHRIAGAGHALWRRKYSPPALAVTLKAAYADASMQSVTEVDGRL